MCTKEKQNQGIILDWTHSCRYFWPVCNLMILSEFNNGSSRQRCRLIQLFELSFGKGNFKISNWSLGKGGVQKNFKTNWWSGGGWGQISNMTFFGYIIEILFYLSWILSSAIFYLWFFYLLSFTFCLLSSAFLVVIGCLSLLIMPTTQSCQFEWSLMKI